MSGGQSHNLIDYPAGTGPAPLLRTGLVARGPVGQKVWTVADKDRALDCYGTAFRGGGGYVGTLRLKKKKKKKKKKYNAAPMDARATTTPPTTPPAMAPTFDLAQFPAT